MRKYFFSSIRFIQLFGEGGAGGTAGAAGTAGAGGESPAGQTEAALAQPQRKGRANPLADVQYGLPEEEEAPVAAEQEQPADRAAEFDKLIKGEYKDLYTQRIQDTVSKRLKGTEQTVAAYKQLQDSGTLDILGKHYGVDPSNMAELTKAIREDAALYERRAMENNTTVQEIMRQDRMDWENAQLKKQLEAYRQKEAAEKTYDGWLQQGEALKSVYPHFDLRQEAKNPQFLSLLQSGIDVRTAYEVIHKDEMIQGALQFGAKRAEERVANAVQAGQRRPAEGAMAPRATTTRKTDVTQLTRADRDEIERRVARGEKIRF